VSFMAHGGIKWTNQAITGIQLTAIRILDEMLPFALVESV